MQGPTGPWSEGNRSMWFKTRAGLSCVTEPMEIRVTRYPKSKPPSYLIWARSLNDATVEYKGVFGKLNSPGRFVSLAEFELSDSSVSAVAQCMKRIEDAIVSGANICDLSMEGQAEAWGDGWTLVDWARL